METRKNIIVDGNVTIKGKNSQGYDLIVEAPVENLCINVVREYNDYSNFHRDEKVFKEEEITFSMKLKHGSQFTVKVPHLMEKPLERTARVEVGRYAEGEVVPPLTIKAIRDAAKRAGVDENTAFTDATRRDNVKLDLVRHIEFSWED